MPRLPLFFRDTTFPTVPETARLVRAYGFAQLGADGAAARYVDRYEAIAEALPCLFRWAALAGLDPLTEFEAQLLAIGAAAKVAAASQYVMQFVTWNVERWPIDETGALGAAGLAIGKDLFGVLENAASTLQARASGDLPPELVCVNPIVGDVALVTRSQALRVWVKHGPGDPIPVAATTHFEVQAVLAVYPKADRLVPE